MNGFFRLSTPIVRIIIHDFINYNLKRKTGAQAASTAIICTPSIISACFGALGSHLMAKKATNGTCPAMSICQIWAAVPSSASWTTPNMATLPSTKARAANDITSGIHALECFIVEISPETAGEPTLSFPNWRRGWDSNPRGEDSPTRFPGAPVRPLQHLSAAEQHPAGDYASVAERVGFEPTRTCTLPLFESGTFNHSDTSPIRVYHGLVTRKERRRRPPGPARYRGRARRVRQPGGRTGACCNRTCRRT
jgi:hypothetical protein